MLVRMLVVSVLVDTTTISRAFHNDNIQTTRLLNTGRVPRSTAQKFNKSAKCKSFLELEKFVRTLLLTADISM